MDKVKVEQVDREAAAEYDLMIGRITPRDADAMRAGEWDDTSDVQFFARHRLNTLASASTPVETAKRLARRMGAEFVPHEPPAADAGVREASEPIATVQMIETVNYEVGQLREALNDIVNPLAMLQRRAEAEGGQLSDAAYSIANDLEFVKGIARAALSQAGEVRK